LDNKWQISYLRRSFIPSDNVDEDYKRLKEAGVEFLGEPQTIEDWGMRCVYFRDPEGNLLSLEGDII